MATLEERLTLIEHEYTKLKHDTTELKKTMELQTIAIGALVNKAALERLNEKYDKMFDTLIAHDRFTNEQLAELRGQQIELDGMPCVQQGPKAPPKLKFFVKRVRSFSAKTVFLRLVF